MRKKLSLKLRFTLLNISLLVVCCIILTIILNFSANKMADVIEAIPITPAYTIDGLALMNSIPITQSASSEISIAARSSFLQHSIISMLLLIIFGGFFTYFISLKALKPLKELSCQMKNRTIYNLSEALPIPESNDEIAELTKSFNEMSSKLEEAFAMQKRFSQSAAHELRTPLTVLRTKVDIFKKKNIHTKEEYSHLLDTISTYTNRLSDLVKNLLDITNMDALLCNQTIDLHLLLTDIIEELSSLAAKRGICITLSSNSHTIIANESLIHRVFYNLIENAINYNYENGSVEISVIPETNGTRIKIIDTGIGIKSDMKELIFEPFFRVDKSRSRSMGGAGLGLTLVKNIVEKHQGTIQVNETITGGSCFEIFLP